MPNQPKTPVRSIRIEDELWDATRDAATKEGTTTTAVVRKALSAYVRTASAVACALVALVLLSGCGGSSQAAADARDLTAARQTVAAQASASASAAADAQARALAGECTLTGDGTDFLARSNDPNLAAGTPTAIRLAAALAWLAWVQDQPVGCTASDVTKITDTITGVTGLIKALQAG